MSTVKTNDSVVARQTSTEVIMASRLIARDDKSYTVIGLS